MTVCPTCGQVKPSMTTPTWDKAKRLLTHKGQTVQFSVHEAALVSILFDGMRQSCRADMIALKIWGIEDVDALNCLRVLKHKVSQKLPPDTEIHTMHGYGIYWMDYS